MLQNTNRFHLVHHFIPITWFQITQLFNQTLIILGDAQNLIVSQGALKQISNLLEKCTVPNAVENNVKFKATLIGLFLNLIAENESIHAQVTTYL